MATFDELKAIVLDNTRSREERLLAFWTLSATHWHKRMRRIESAEVAESDSVRLSKRIADQRLVLRRKVERFAAGSNRVRQIRGVMAISEAPDMLHTHQCEFCGRGFSPNRPYLGRAPLYCSGACRSAAYRQRKAVA